MHLSGMQRVCQSHKCSWNPLTLPKFEDALRIIFFVLQLFCVFLFVFYVISCMKSEVLVLCHLLATAGLVD